MVKTPYIFSYYFYFYFLEFSSPKNASGGNAGRIMSMLKNNVNTTSPICLFSLIKILLRQCITDFTNIHYTKTVILEGLIKSYS